MPAHHICSCLKLLRVKNWLFVVVCEGEELSKVWSNQLKVVSVQEDTNVTWIWTKRHSLSALFAAALISAHWRQNAASRVILEKVFRPSVTPKITTVHCKKKKKTLWHVQTWIFPDFFQHSLKVRLSLSDEVTCHTSSSAHWLMVHFYLLCPHHSSTWLFVEFIRKYKIKKKEKSGWSADESVVVPRYNC